MVYKVIGLMSGSSLDGLDIAHVHLQENKGKWEYQFIHTACYPYPDLWTGKLTEARNLSALEYQLLHTEYGHYSGQQVNRFIEEYSLHYQVQLIVSHGHTTFHLPERKMTAQLGDGAALAAVTGINVVSDLRSMDIALGGQGAPLVPLGEKLLLPGYHFFLNLGGIANLSYHAHSGPFIGFDVCPANRVLNLLAAQAGKAYDENGALAAGGRMYADLLERLNALPYYEKGYPKSLANEFGTEVIYPMLHGILTADALRTYTEHIAFQVSHAVGKLMTPPSAGGMTQDTSSATPLKMLVTGGGAHNSFLIEKLREALKPLGVAVEVPARELVDYKEALVMALLGVLRWREENTVLSSVTGAVRDSIGGAVWIGQEA